MRGLLRWGCSRPAQRILPLLLVWLAGRGPWAWAGSFEGQVKASYLQGGETLPLLYTVSSNCLRVEVAATNRPYPVNLWDRHTGEVTLLFPHNRSFARVKPASADASARRPPMPLPTGVPGNASLPGVPGPGAGLPAGLPPRAEAGVSAAALARARMPGGMLPGVGPQAGWGAMPAAPPMLPPEPLELKATGAVTNLLGYRCAAYELSRGQEKVELWATAALGGFEPWLGHLPHPAHAAPLEEDWPQGLGGKGLFPLRASFSDPAGSPRVCFEVQAIAPAAPGQHPAASLFEPPADYHRLPPLPF